MEMKSIGTIHTSFTDLAGMPIQPAGAAGVKGTVEVFEEYQDGLQDLDGFSYIVLLYTFHRSKGYNLQVVPFKPIYRLCQLGFLNFSYLHSMQLTG